MIVKIKGTDDVIKFPDGTDEGTILKALQGYMGEQTLKKPQIPEQQSSVVPKQKPPEAFAKIRPGVFKEIINNRRVS